jgi:hypothetical protein
MDDNEIARRLKLIRVIVTPDERVENTIVRVGTDRVWIRSAQPKSDPQEDQEIDFDTIRRPTGPRYRVIIASFRQILGLDNADG